PTTALSPLSLHDALPISLVDGLVELGEDVARLARIVFAPRLVVSASERVVDLRLVGDEIARGLELRDRTVVVAGVEEDPSEHEVDRKSTRLNSSHSQISY